MFPKVKSHTLNRVTSWCHCYGEIWCGCTTALSRMCNGIKSWL